MVTFHWEKVSVIQKKKALIATEKKVSKEDKLFSFQ